MNYQVFIIDDDPIYRMICKKMITTLDSSLIINQCENGEVGIEKLEYLKNSDQNIIVLLDINMPVLNGWGFLDKIEKSNLYNINQLNIYIVTSSVDQSDLLKSQQYSFLKGFISKPLSREDIKTSIGLN